MWSDIKPAVNTDCKKTTLIITFSKAKTKVGEATDKGFVFRIITRLFGFIITEHEGLWPSCSKS